mgnify:FL=1
MQIILKKPLINIISHTDLDGVVAAAVAWYALYPESAPLQVNLLGYGEVDNAILEAIQSGRNPLILDLFCQRRETIDIVDSFFEGGPPICFDHHETTLQNWGNRPWLKIDTSCCAAKVYYSWLMSQDLPERVRSRLILLSDIVEVANDRDLWLGQNPESRLWQALITMCGPWSVFSRLVANPSSSLSDGEYEATTEFVHDQEARFAEALEKVKRYGDDLMAIGPELLEFGDVSDFCGLILDRTENPPKVVAVANKKVTGEWAVSLRSRSGLAGKITGMLRDGRKVRGGGHGDAAALYFPPHYSLEQICDSILSAIKLVSEQESPISMTLGDILKGKLKKD